MKTYKINYKLQSVSSATKPIQLVLSLNTKWEGKYLYQICSIGKSVLPEEWDAKRNIPKKAEIAGKLLEVKETIENSLNTSDAANLEDESVNTLFAKGYFKQQCEEVIKAKIQNMVTPIAEYLNKNYKWQELQREEVYEEIKEKIRLSNFFLVDSDNKKINLEWFFNLEIAPKAEQFNESILLPQPEAIIQKAVPVISHDSCLIHEIDVKKYGSLKYSEFVDLIKYRKMKSGALSDGSGYDVLISIFNEYDDTITVNELTDEVFIDFFDYLQEERDLEVPSYNNYKKWINAVFAFARSQLAVQFNSKILNINSDIFNRFYEKVTRPYLTEMMLSHLLNLNLDAKHKHLEYVRDLFYVQSYTSVTYVDLPQLFKKVQEKTVDGEQIKYSHIRRIKTGVEADIVIFDEVLSILEKYDFSFSKISNAYYNRAIKDTMEYAGFTDEFKQERFNTKTKTSTYKTAPFCSFIGSHTGRRSYITNMKKRGISDESIMSQSQHLSKKAYDLYNQDSKTINFENFVREVKVNKK